jgi:glycosyltransferase involved in cell wall biosynthesis
MAAGVALIATNLLEVSNVIHGSGCGITIEESKSEDIREAILRFRDNRELLESCSKRSKEASKEYCWNIEMENLHKLYNSVGVEFN